MRKLTLEAVKAVVPFKLEEMFSITTGTKIGRKWVYCYVICAVRSLPVKGTTYFLVHYVDGPERRDYGGLAGGKRNAASLKLAPGLHRIRFHLGTTNTALKNLT